MPSSLSHELGLSANGHVLSRLEIAGGTFRITTQNIVLAVAGLVVLFLLFLTDKSTHQWVLSIQTHRFDKLMHVARFVGHAWFSIALSALFTALGYIYKNRKWQRIGRLILGSLLISGLIVLIAKPLFGRQEWSIIGPPPAPIHGSPIQKTALYNMVDSHWGRFPSGDSTVAFSTATSLSIEFPMAAPLFYFLAAIVAFGRFYYSVHLASDVFAGSWLGWFTARFIAAREQAKQSQESVVNSAENKAQSPEKMLAIIEKSKNTFGEKLSQQRQHLLWITLLCVPLFFMGLGAWGFFDPDEGRYAEMPREMIVRHDFITPTLNYFKYFEKPPLLYWAVAGAYQLFGFHEWAARLVPASAALLGVFTAYFLGRRMFGARAGLLGAIVLATSALWVFLARFLVIDMLVSVLIFAALALWWMGHTEAKSARGRLYFLGFWSALALAVLTKGPMAVVLVGATIFIYTALCKNWRAWAKMQWLLGLAVVPAYHRAVVCFGGTAQSGI